MVGVFGGRRSPAVGSIVPLPRRQPGLVARERPLPLSGKVAANLPAPLWGRVGVGRMPSAARASEVSLPRRVGRRVPPTLHPLCGDGRGGGAPVTTRGLVVSAHRS